MPNKLSRFMPFLVAVVLLVAYAILHDRLKGPPGPQGPRGEQGEACPTEELRVKRLVLVDDAGKERAELVMAVSGPVLSMLDDAGKVRVALAVGDDGAALGLWDTAVLLGGVGTELVEGMPITETIRDWRGQQEAPKGSPATHVVLNDGRVVPIPAPQNQQASPQNQQGVPKEFTPEQKEALQKRFKEYYGE